MNLPNNALKYLNKYSFSGWEVETNQTKLFNNAIVIPAISEFENIKNSLASLSNNDRKYFNSTIVLFVINNPVSADSDVKSDNLKSIEFLQGIINKKNTDVFAISCVAKKGLKPLLGKIGELLSTLPKMHLEPDLSAEKHEIPVLKPHLEGGPKTFFIERPEPNEIIIRGKRIEQIANMTNTKNPEAMIRLFDIFKKLGIMRILKKEKDAKDATVVVGKMKIPYQDIPFTS